MRFWLNFHNGSSYYVADPCYSIIIIFILINVNWGQWLVIIWGNGSFQVSLLVWIQRKLTITGMLITCATVVCRCVLIAYGTANVYFYICMFVNGSRGGLTPIQSNVFSRNVNFLTKVMILYTQSWYIIWLQEKTLTIVTTICVRVEHNYPMEGVCILYESSAFRYNAYWKSQKKTCCCFK